MKLVNWQRKVALLATAVGMLGLTTTIAYAAPITGGVTGGGADSALHTGADPGGSSILQLPVARLNFNFEDPSEEFLEGNLDYILGDSIFGTLMFAKANCNSTSSRSGIEGASRRIYA